MSRSQRDAWDAYVALAGPNHPSVQPWMRGGRGGAGNRQSGGLGGNGAPVSATGGGCVVAQQWDRGYWPYPWSEMPPGGLPFDVFDSIATPAANGTETRVLQFQVPFGYDGIVLAVANVFTGPGFVEGSGNLVWRIRVGSPSLQGRPQLNYSNIRNTLGSTQTPRDVQGGIQIVSGQFLEYSVTHALGSPIVPGGTRIICNIQGFYWPRGSTPIASGGAL